MTSFRPDLVNRLFKAFADPTRLRILCLLRGGERCVCDLTAALGVPQPAASRHLAYLRRADLVRVRRHGSWSYYRLASARRAVHRALLNCLGACVRDTAQPSTGRTPVRRRSASACPR